MFISGHFHLLGMRRQGNIFLVASWGWPTLVKMTDTERDKSLENCFHKFFGIKLAKTTLGTIFSLPGVIL